MNELPEDWLQTREGKILYEIASSVRRYLAIHYGWEFETDDLVCAGWLRVTQYCSARDLLTARVYIRQEMVRHAWRERKARGTVLGCGSDPDSIDDRPAAHRDPVCMGDYGRVDDQDMLAWLGRRVPAPPRTALVMERRYCHGLTLMEIGKELGLTRERVRQIIHIYISKVRRYVEGRGLLWDG